MSRRLLLLSNSRDAEGRFLHHAHRHIKAFLGAHVRTVLFIPFAAVSLPWDEYAIRAQAAFAEMGYGLESIHASSDAEAAVRDAEAIVAGGGNTFHLLHHLYRARLLDALRERVHAGAPYLGWSAGSVIACPTIRTTNDMPIIEPPTLSALALVPFQINAHYNDFQPPGFQGETRSERIREFLVVSPAVRVIGLPEGTMLQIERDRIALLGEGSARVFEAGLVPREVAVGHPLDFLLEA